MTETAPSKKSWIDLIDESVHTSDDIDIGDVDAVSRDFVVAKKGFVNVHYYYVPLKKVEGWDGNVLWLKATEEEVKRNYERDVIPEPRRYFVKDYPAYTATYPELTTFAPRYTTPAYTTLSQPEQPIVFKCDLCEAPFRSEDELSAHVASKH
jgi:hypothetical protein